MQLRVTLLTVLVSLFGLACGVGEGSSSFARGTAALSEGTPSAVGILRLLNDRSTTFEILDHDVALDRRAARNLVDHLETRGDFGSIDEVDAVKWVGPVALARLGDHAESHGWVPAGGDLLGTWDGVAFTVEQAEATLLLCNEASEVELDVDAGLDRRAVRSILAARPLASILELSGLYYVGHSAMLDLREYRTSLDPNPPPVETLPEGSDCDSNDACSSGVCAGLTIGMGFCVADWMEGTYSSNDARQHISHQGPVSGEILVSGQASVPMDVIVTLDIDHPRPQDLFVELFQPNGGYDVLWDLEARPSLVVNSYGVERDNAINGVWRLSVTDRVTGESGWLNGWSMWVTSRYD